MDDLMKLTAKYVGGEVYYDLHGSVPFRNEAYGGHDP